MLTHRHRSPQGEALTAISGVFRPVATFVDDQILERLRLHGWTFFRDAVLIATAFVLAEFARFDGHIPARDLRMMLLALPFVALVFSVSNHTFSVHRRMWKYAGMADMRAIVDASLVSVLVIAVVDIAVRDRFLPLSVVLTGGVFAFCNLVAVRVGSRLTRSRDGASTESLRVLIVGAGQGGQMVAADLAAHAPSPEYAVGFLDDDPGKRKRQVHGIPVLGSIDALVEIVQEQKIDILAVAMPSASTVQIDRVLALAQMTNARIQILPSHAEVLAGRTSSMQLHDINLNNLLDRIPSTEGLQTTLVQKTVEGRVVLVTGAAGSIGSELCRQLLTLGPTQVIALDNNETGLFHLHRELSAMPGGEILKPVLTSVTAEPKVRKVFARYQPDMVFHAAAYKHVPILQDHVDEAVFVNVKGTLNICKSALDYGCERFVFVSTDKAVDPVNALGFSKRIGELLARAHQDGGGTIFCSVRFGNVIGSRGSALPEFVRQIDEGGPVTVTHPDVERYFMTIPEAVSLVIQAGALATGGELFMLDMGEPVKIGDLVKRLIRLRGLRVGQDIAIKYTGLRPGEKLTEDLVFADERTSSTAISSILVVDDDCTPNLKDLERRIDLLVQIATHDDADAIAVALATTAKRALELATA
jgi:FlaA1/EpsC-like NDP-sugar epimerase